MKTSRTKQSAQNTYLINKYGFNSVQILKNYLQDELDCNGELKKAQKLKEQIEYLEREKKSYISKEKNYIIQQIMICVEQEGQNILNQFQSSTKTDFLELLTDIEAIQLELKNQHEKQYKLLENELIIDLKMFLQKKSSPVVNELYQQLQLLCSSQLYQQAQKVKKRLEKEIQKHGEKKYYEWKEYKQMRLNNLALKQQKQKQSQKQRFDIMIIEEKKRKNEQYDILKKKINVMKKKMLQNLIKKQSKYQKEISSLTNSRIKVQHKKKRQMREIQMLKNKLSLNMDRFNDETLDNIQ